MFAALRARATYANVVATLALVLATTSPVWADPAANAAASAATTVKRALKLGKRADKRSKRAIAAAQRAERKANLALVTGGPPGPRGPQGASGRDGSPDTPAQILEKLKQVDGANSGLDAALLAGKGPLEFATKGGGDRDLRFYSALMATDVAETIEFLDFNLFLETPGDGTFRLCGLGSAYYVQYLNGARTTGAKAPNACAPAFNPGPGDDFELTVNGMRIFGNPVSQAQETFIVQALSP